MSSPSLQLLAAGVTTAPNYNGIPIVFIIVSISGLIFFAVFVALITENVISMSRELMSGRTQVHEKDHTLILGWNEATLRTIIQLCFVRRLYQEGNEKKFGRILGYLPILRWALGALGLLERPSTSCEVNNIVVLANEDHVTKEYIHKLIVNACLDRGIDPKRTTVGENVVVRVGNTSDANDLMRVGAHRAAAILVMVNKEDAHFEAEDGIVENGATLRCMLALRYVLFNYPYSEAYPMHPEIRIILQMSRPSIFINSASFLSPTGRDVVYPMDLSVFSNTLMFGCVGFPGLGRIFLSLLALDGTCFRRRKAINLKSGPDRAYGACIGSTFDSLAREFVDSVLVGVIKPELNRDSDLVEERLGLCCDPQRVIEEGDLLIFVGPSPNPLTSAEEKAQNEEFVKAGEAHVAVYYSGAKGEKVDGSEEGSAEKNNQSDLDRTKVIRNSLVLGWRPIWEEELGRFGARISELFNGCLPGSSVTFVNTLPIEEMDDIFKGLGLKLERRFPIDEDALDEDEVNFFLENESLPSPGADDEPPFAVRHRRERAVYLMPSPFLECRVVHICGDGASPEVLEPVVFETNIHSAIILSTEARAPRSPVHAVTDGHRDTRVLSMLLLLRKLHSIKGDNSPIHIIGENTEDMTEKLAIGPRWRPDGEAHDVGTIKSGKSPRRRHPTPKIPDFVNSQAIFARVLAQAAAYPMIVPSMRQLFDTSRDTANLEVVSCIYRIALDVPLSWGLVREVIQKGLRSPTRDEQGRDIQPSVVICLGYVDFIIFRESYRVIVLRRRVSPRFFSDSSAIIGDMDSKGVLESEGEMFVEKHGIDQ
jgi:hypothetical protein